MSSALLFGFLDFSSKLLLIGNFKNSEKTLPIREPLLKQVCGGIQDIQTISEKQCSGGVLVLLLALSNMDGSLSTLL